MAPEKTDRETLIALMTFLKHNLEELKDIRDDDENQFAYGEKVAYLECYERLGLWRDAAAYGWNPSAEDEYPL